MPDQGESLTRSAAEYDLDLPTAYSGPISDFRARQGGNRLCQHRAVWKVVLVDSAMDWVDFYRGNDIEASLLEAQAESSRTGKQIDSYRTRHRQSPST
jgi:hypothetical protein